MKELLLYYLTNRNHIGANQWNPRSYGTKFSDDGIENLRFGKVTVEVEEEKISKCLEEDCGFGSGNGEKLSTVITDAAKRNSDIRAFPEKIDRKISETLQTKIKKGSAAMFSELKDAMMNSTDIVVFVHGFNVSWHNAVGTALSLQEMLNRPGVEDESQKVLVVLFTWPSDGMMMPFVSYKSDRSEAKGSGKALGRGVLKLRDFLITLRGRAKDSGEKLCDQDIHLLCHSMGNYVLQNSITRISQYTPGSALPRLFDNIFLCAPDVDDDVFEQNKPLASLNELANTVTVYHNKGDVAMYISDYTKGNPERLGTGGAGRPELLHHKIHQVNCTPVVKGFIEHSYYLSGKVNDDIKLSIDGYALNDNARTRVLISSNNVWMMK